MRRNGHRVRVSDQKRLAIAVNHEPQSERGRLHFVSLGDEPCTLVVRCVSEQARKRRNGLTSPLPVDWWSVRPAKAACAAPLRVAEAFTCFAEPTHIQRLPVGRAVSRPPLAAPFIGKAQPVRVHERQEMVARILCHANRRAQNTSNQEQTMLCVPGQSRFARHSISTKPAGRPNRIPRPRIHGRLDCSRPSNGNSLVRCRRHARRAHAVPGGVHEASDLALRCTLPRTEAELSSRWPKRGRSPTKGRRPAGPASRLS